MDHGHTRTFEAKRVFTDREEPVALFTQALGQPQTRDQYRVLAWYGVGGQGKSSLCKEMQRHLREQGSVAIGSLDFENIEDRQPVWALLKLRGDLKKSGLQFPTFDLAYLRYFGLQNPGKDIRVVHPELFRRGENEIANDLLDWSEEGIKEFGKELVKDVAVFVPGTNLLYKYGTRLTGKLRDWWNSREVKDRLLDLDGHAAAELAERLPLYLGFDLWRAQAESDCPRIVLTVDTHEKLWGEGGAEGAGINLRVDQWLRDLLEKSPGILCLLFGRDRLRWGELDPDWNEALEQHLLGGLSESDADWFLRQVPIDDPAIRTRIIQGSDGLPFYLDLAVGQYETLLAKGLAPSRDAFGCNPRDIIQRFLQYLGVDEKRDLMLASYLDRVDEALFHQLAETFLGGAAVVNLAQLKRRSVLEENSQGHLSLHALMRQALQDQEKDERPELFERIHRFLFEHFDQKAAVESARDIDDRCVTALLETLPHAVALGMEEFETWLFSHVEHYSTAGEYQLLQSIFEQSLLMFTENTWQYANSASWLARTYVPLGRLDKAEAMYHKALEIHEALGRRADMANQYNNLGIVYQTLERLDQAEAMYHKALAINEALGRQEDMATQYSNLGTLYQTCEQLDQAEAMYHKALEINDTLGHQAGKATQYSNLGTVYQTRGQLDQAEAMYHKSLKIEEALGRQEGMASDYGYLGNLYQTRRQLNQAEAMFYKALEIHEALGHQQGMANDYGNLGNAYRIRGQLDQAEAMFYKALEIHEALGHQVGVATQCSNLGIVYQTRERHDQAEAMYYKALEINETLGLQAGMAIQYGNLGTLYQTHERIDQAEAMYHKALAINEALGLQEGMATQYGNLGIVYKTRGQLDQAEAMYLRALEINMAFMYYEGMANDYGNLGVVYEGRGELAGARRHWLLARDLYAKFGSPNEQIVQSWIDSLDTGSE